MELSIGFLAFLLASASAEFIPSTDTEDGLIAAHILFRHGNRTIEDSIYDSNPYGNESLYAPYGYNQLSKEGKRTEYRLGQMFKERYGSLVGSKYLLDLIEARSTVTERTKMSMLLVLAGLFPPDSELQWEEQLGTIWQPIPYSTYDYDKVLYGRKVCTNYKPAYKKYVKTDEILEILKPYQEMFDYLTEKTGQDIQKAKKAADLYIELITQIAYGYPVEDWFYEYQEAMFNITVLNYRLMAGKKKLKRLSTGYFLQKIIEDTENKILEPNSSTKLYLYAAHEKNIATLLVTLDVFDDSIPTFGSHVFIELHRISGVYGFKFYYQNYKQAEAVLLKIPGCEEFCPLATFKTIVADWIPESDDYCELDV
ncbi:hypothetical protein ABEB36_006470 [Hypothenemus hampei]|uniref:acid phosphatase n=1 Tax=Hypothenemus hampei TaxID=57062 RepID=A0ABD1ESW2_HYPHA